MFSLATLSLCFPKSSFWQINQIADKPSEYVDNFLNEIYLPVLRATKELEILNLILRIMCEAWLDHIYMQKIKFRFDLFNILPFSNIKKKKNQINLPLDSREGALNLLRDFEGVSEWIIACKFVQPEHVEILAKHEVLRTCEGVGKILLRKPFEIISMVEPIQFTPKVQNQPNTNGIYKEFIK